MSEHDDNALIDAILASGVKIPAMPAVLVELQARKRDERSGPREYAAAIARDPAMAGAVFRVANSPVLGRTARVDALETAVTILGQRTTEAVVRSECLRGAFHEPELAMAMDVLWQRMNVVADLVLATVRRARLRFVREDIAFQAAIFHDCGVAVLARRDPAYAGAFVANGAWPDLAALDLAHNTSHAVVGLMVARNWQLPPEVAETVRHHHSRRPETLAEPVRTLAALVRFACHLLDSRTGVEDGEWHSVWKTQAEALFRQVDQDPAEIEVDLLSLLP